ncbi:TIGR03790 family protein [uncultured Desulfosarcina sp.]|uniref:TIGR03790 family protein n=1 Tax=uncultured Desulfosarcina sp. TaxID=218289 RepID=UPI0029C7FD76|nr:TIGR03790 family protein [uncultured Desulfosarcina sp.]
MLNDSAWLPFNMKRMVYHRLVLIILWPVVFIPLMPWVSMALEPGEILILANKNTGEGVELARYYAKKRNIPDANLLLLSLPDDEMCRRDLYEKQIAVPVRAFLEAIKPSRRIRCLVLMYGMPLKVGPSEHFEAENDKASEAREGALKKRMEDRHGEDEAASPSVLAEELKDVRKRLDRLKITTDQRASVDSELSVVRHTDAPVGGWVENPFYLGFRSRSPAVSQEAVLMVSRLDGPTPASVKRIIDDSISVEKTGLSGTAYFDARWPMGQSPAASAYQIYDRSIHRAAQRVEKSGRMPVVIDEADALFQPGQCPDAALYCGWYSLATYVDAFSWQRGAVGFHIASSECTTLKKESSQVWCKRMIEKGVCATIGPVGEPYVQAFPLPELFFGFLTEGILSLAECYMVSLPFLSWKMVLVGDPLYRPFKKSQQPSPSFFPACAN